jgi:hypothetical protein
MSYPIHQIRIFYTYKEKNKIVQNDVDGIYHLKLTVEELYNEPDIYKIVARNEGERSITGFNIKERFPELLQKIKIIDIQLLKYLGETNYDV